jgi:glycosyltransferase involved in cell wall biosynthesis
LPDDVVTVVLPRLNEEESLPAVLAAIPVGYRALVVDNNSTDGTAAVAGRHGAAVVAEPRPGVVAAATPIVAVIDADGSMDPGDTLRSQANFIAQMTVIADVIAV